jgi:sugar lactone lactonase YvrE
MPRRGLRTLAAGLLVLTAGLTIATSGIAAPESTAKSRARVHYKQGESYQKAGQYAAALKEYSIAYELLPVPELLFNLGQANRLAGNKEAALQNYRLFLQSGNNGRGSDEARAWVAKLSAELEGDAGHKPKVPPPEAAAERPDLAAPADLAVPPDLAPAASAAPPRGGGPPRLAGASDSSGTTDGDGNDARFDGPSGVVTDGAGNAYIADSLNGTIRKLVLATRAVSTLAGSPGKSGSTDGPAASALFGAPEGLALDGAVLYVADPKNCNVRRIDLAGGTVSTVAGVAGAAGSEDGSAAQARFSAPVAVASDGHGALYVADAGNNKTIRKIVLATGEVSTLAGSPGISGAIDGKGAEAHFSSPRGLVADRGFLYVTDATTNSVRKIGIQTGVVTTLAGAAGVSGSADGVGLSARFLAPDGIAVDTDGSLYVADTGNNAIRKIAAGRKVTTLVHWDAANGPVGLTILGGGELLVTHQDHTLFRLRVR